MGNATVTVADILAEAERLIEYLEGLGYDSVGLYGVKINSDETITFDFTPMDDFQRHLGYDIKCQVGTVNIEYLSGDETKLLNREQRELHVLLAQQGESTAIAGMLTSAAGKRFTDVIHAERAKYAQLVDFS